MNHEFVVGSLRAIAALFTVSLWVVPAAGQPTRDAALTVLHTGDLHGHVTAWRGWDGDIAGKTVGGMDRIAGLVNGVRQEVGREAVLLLDSGDSVGDTMIASLTKGAVVIEAMNAIGYDAITFGNHEPDYGVTRLRELMNMAKFPFVAVNVFKAPGRELFTQPYTVVERAGTKVGIIGLAYANTPLTTAKKNVEGLTYEHAPDAVRDAVEQARKAGATLVIVLSHAGLAGDQRLASMVPGIDVIVGGHSHNRVDEPLRQGNTLIVGAGAHGSHVGRLDLTLKGGSLAGHRWRLLAVDHASVPSDARVRTVVDRALDQHRAALEEQVGEAAAQIIRAQTLAGTTPEKRDQLSAADVLFADILRAHAGADVAFLPGVGYGVAIGPGRITAEDLRNLIPHESKAVTMTLRGKQIREVLEQSIHNVYTDQLREKVGGMIQVSGVQFQYDPMKPRGEQLVEVVVGEAPLAPERTYSVVTNSLLAEGGHNYRTFTEAADRKEGREVYEIVKAWFAKAGPVTPPRTDAIQKVGS